VPKARGRVSAPPSFRRASSRRGQAGRACGSIGWRPGRSTSRGSTQGWPRGGSLGRRAKLRARADSPRRAFNEPRRAERRRYPDDPRARVSTVPTCVATIPGRTAGYTAVPGLRRGGKAPPRRPGQGWARLGAPSSIALARRRRRGGTRAIAGMERPAPGPAPAQGRDLGELERGALRGTQPPWRDSGPRAAGPIRPIRAE